ncbi:DUF2884 family protein [Alteromonas sp. ASW11-130]|uniref:DUF2884 family protein n=1 Tax=Alteromonas sp. ASW11-130 TaxID=3015775 RepID=UPI002242904D|nr:DUF2884 family protein [Alteromonas sp. ASW11-130]MCW8092678.1 YggN family protein [Alteromonas sp. ASW11-130]
MKLFFALTMTTAMLTTPVFAHNYEADCDVNLEGNISYNRGVLEIETDNGTVLTINQSHNLLIDGKELELNAKQQGAVSDYYENISDAIPMTVNIATEGLQLASGAVSEVFVELLGDSEIVRDFDDLFTEISTEVKARFYDTDGGYRVDTREFNDDGWMNSTWENRFEERVESLVEESIGQILISVGQEMLWENGDIDAFVEKMERFGDNIEEKVERQAETLEDKAEELCHVLKKADKAEYEMQSSIAELASLNVLNID